MQDFHLTVRAGSIVALVGTSGSGKTTVTNLLMRFYDPQTGRVRIGDTNIRDVTISDLRNQIAVVTQEIILFNDTIRNNIALGRPGATTGKSWRQPACAFAHDFIVARPEGYRQR